MKKRYMILLMTVFLISGYFVFQSTQKSTSAKSSVSFAKDVQPILNSRCASCHMGKSQSGGLSMNTYDHLMSGSDDGAVIVAGNAEGSVLVQKVKAGEMPKRGPKLTPAQLQTIIDWINAGAQNN